MAAAKAVVDDAFDSRLEDDRDNLVACLDRVDDFESSHNFAKARVLAIKMRGVGARMAHKKLRATSVETSVRHREHSAIVTLIAALHFAIDLPSWPAGAAAVGAAALNDEVRNHAVKREPVVKTLLGEFAEIGNGVWRIGIEELDDHVTFSGLDSGFRHRARRIRDAMDNGICEVIIRLSRSFESREYHGSPFVRFASMIERLAFPCTSHAHTEFP